MPAEERARDPHPHVAPAPRPRILASALDAVGNTPLIRINKITEEEGVECEILAKCEFFNAGWWRGQAGCARGARARARPRARTKFPGRFKFESARHCCRRSLPGRAQRPRTV
jgi:hypothetical protein